MHKISCSVEIFAHCGEAFPRFEAMAKKLRYSPVREVCEVGTEVRESSVSPSWFIRQKNLLNLCDSPRPYTACAGCPIPEPPGDDYRYALFAFGYGDPRRGGKAAGFSRRTGTDRSPFREPPGRSPRPVRAVRPARVGGLRRPTPLGTLARANASPPVSLPDDRTGGFLNGARVGQFADGRRANGHLLAEPTPRARWWKTKAWRTSLSSDSD